MLLNVSHRVGMYFDIYSKSNVVSSLRLEHTNKVQCKIAENGLFAHWKSSKQASGQVSKQTNECGIDHRETPVIYYGSRILCVCTNWCCHCVCVPPSRRMALRLHYAFGIILITIRPLYCFLVKYARLMCEALSSKRLAHTNATASYY